ncbi:MAG TPA: strawberry notch family protein, partial [Bacillales bacterium]|nr:strawberry notch family protein [Bacillales bacterium]
FPKSLYTDDVYLPHDKVVKGGEYTLSDVQIEAVMAAKFNWLAHNKRGILIADDTGMGKTAEQLGIIADAWYSKRAKRILVVTVKDQVAEESFLVEKDKFNFSDIPMFHPEPEYAKQNDQYYKDDTLENKPDQYRPFDFGDGVLLMSQYTFKDSTNAVKSWLDGADGDVLIVLDESHIYKNTNAIIGMANQELFERYNKKGQFVYASATAAEDLEGMEHLYGLGMWNTNTFIDFTGKLMGFDVGTRSGGRTKESSMSKSFRKSGKSPFARDIPLTMMEQITREMKMRGQYIGRQLSIEGVTTEAMNVGMTSEDIGDWNRAVQFIQLIAEKAEEHGEKPTDRGQIMGSVVGYMRRLRGYYALKGIIEDMKKQEKS